MEQSNHPSKEQEDEFKAKFEALGLHFRWDFESQDEEFLQLLRYMDAFKEKFPDYYESMKGWMYSVRSTPH